jgi:hypothetical protein
MRQQKALLYHDKLHENYESFAVKFCLTLFGWTTEVPGRYEITFLMSAGSSHASPRHPILELIRGEDDR